MKTHAIVVLVAALQTAHAEPAGEVLTADTPKATVIGDTFIAPAGWTPSVSGGAMILVPPEGDSHVVLFDVKAVDGDAALAAARAAYKPDMKWPLRVANDAR